ncbi:HPr kinase/phosphorylase [Radicibacter daui]|uniref:HPr kinase/phosphorylase n=1 Tax=Radicibacter daui TaxID=3064829 RepID=UPI004046B308
MLRLHASCVALESQAILLLGPSGSGKSDLALRLIAAGAGLVADDVTVVEAVGDGTLAAFAPPQTAGLIEARGLGILRLPECGRATVRLILRLAAPGEQIERLPHRREETLEGVALPVVTLAPFEGSAVAKAQFALQAALDPGLCHTGALEKPE